ncbi:MAG: capsule assembly Wzi family protein [Bacteroidales bacterium]|nr:capsule assembly Wzi family protein [Bacteroidales bacterium]
MDYKILKSLFVATLLLISNSKVVAQEKLTYDASFHSLVSSDDVRPMWLVANEWGRFNQFGSSESLLELGGSYKVFDTQNFTLDAGIRGLVNFDFTESALQEAYLSGQLWFIDFSLGKEQYSPVIINDELTSGLFLLNSNTRPIPKITLGIFDYLPLGFTNNWVEVKGGMSQGWLNDDRIEKSNSANDVLLHEKFAYMRLGNTKIKPYAGLVHSALFGGTRPDGTEIPIDFWATFTASGSATLGGGEETNAAGAHMGMWDFGFNWESDFGDVHFYWQKPFADGSGLRIYNGNNKDYIIGALVQPKELNWLTGFSIEVFKTDYQSGAGIPDPLYPVDYDGHKAGSIIWMRDIEDDFDSFMHTVFPDTEGTTGWTEEQVMHELEVRLNEGNKYGGRDDYMNNGYYYNGWVYNGMNMGTALFHTSEKVRKYASSWDEVDQVNLYNNRVNGIHLGAEGHFSPTFKYLIKSTFTVNKGTYGEEFRGRGSWTNTQDYFFSESKKQVYSLLELSWNTPWLDELQIRGRLAVDTGELYDSTGGQISIIYSPVVKK